MTRIVDREVERPVPRQRLLEHRLDPALARHVGPQEESLPAGLPSLLVPGDQLGGLLTGAAAAGEDDLGAAPRQPERGVTPDPLARPGDERDLLPIVVPGPS